MEKNIGPVDGVCRITLGLTMLAIGAADMVHRDTVWNRLLIMAGAMSTAEGILRFSPWMALAGISTAEARCRLIHKSHSEDGDESPRRDELRPRWSWRRHPRRRGVYCP